MTCSAIVLTTSLLDIREQMKVLELILSFILRTLIGVCFGMIYTYMGELFPTRIRATATGLMVLFGRFGASLTSFITSYENSKGIHPSSFLLFLDLLAFVPFSMLPETNKMVISN